LVHNCLQGIDNGRAVDIGIIHLTNQASSLGVAVVK
jgi:hypothetical protein